METTTTTTTDVATTFIDIIPEVPKIKHLEQEPTEIVCPTCNQRNFTRVQKDVVTFMQHLAAAINFVCFCCKPIRWSGRYDINHFCSKCGCYIGRYITLSWYKRKVFKWRRSSIDKTNRWHKALDRHIKRNQNVDQQSKTQQQQGEQIQRHSNGQQ